MNYSKTLLASCVLAMTSLGAWADGSVSGHVSSETDGPKLEGAQVRIDELGHSTATDRNGRFRFTSLPAGQYTLTIDYLGTAPVSRTIEIKDDQNLVENVSMDGGSDSMELVMARGTASGINRALNRQRTSNTITNVVSSDSIGQFPDANTAEALSRVPGLSIERDQGEGRFVRVRGLGPAFNSVNINGVKIPAPEAGTRAVALDVVPSDLLQSLEVTKALTPDMDADSLGGSINIKSLSAFDQDGTYWKLSAEASHDGLVEETSPKLAATFSDRFDVGHGADNLGIAAAISWYDRDFGSDNVETGGAWDFENSPALLEELEQRDYTINRERLGAVFNVDYHASDRDHYFIRTLFSEFSDLETRQANIIEFENPQAAGARGDATWEREVKNREEVQEINSIAIGGEHKLDQWELDYQAGFSSASEENYDSMDGALFEADISNVGFENSRRPGVLAPANAYQAGSFDLTEVEVSNTLAEDDEQSYRFDALRHFILGEHSGQMKMGVKASLREKSSNEDIAIYEDLDQAGFSPQQLSLESYTSGVVDYGLGNFGPAIDSAALRQALSPLNRDDYIDDEESAIASYKQEETVNAAYWMASLDMGALNLLTGLRYEDTDFDAEGNQVVDGTISKRIESNEYDHVLPALHARYAFNDSTQLRAAFTQSIVRPDFEQLSPAVVIDGDEAEFGNPQLKALESTNLDIGIEHYFGHAGVLSAFAFAKDIDNFIYQVDVAGSGPWSTFDEAITFDNGDDAELTGLELAYSKQFTQLPAPWDGLLVSANATFSDSEADLGTRTIALPNQSDTTTNLSVGYENDQFGVRLSNNYKSEYLIEVSDIEDPALDIYQDAHSQIDLSANYYPQSNMRLFVEVLNINDEPYYAYTGNGKYNAQFEDYDPTVRIGFSMTNF